MCGFVGIYTDQDAGPAASRLKAATDLLAHRGPDDEAYYLGPGFSAGFRRLKIIDLSVRGRQPMADESGRYWIVFNGEIYNYRELREELRRAGREFRTATDTEVLLAAYVHWGEDCLSRLNGMFAFLIWDRRERRLFGARDRFGEKPLYYAETPGATLFASEIKALWPLMDEAPAYRAGVVRAYLRDGKSDIGSDTFYRGVHAVPAGHKLTVQRGRLGVARYWQLEASETFRGDPVEAFRDTWLDSIRLRTRSDVPLGTCLSGGLDSGSIVCGLTRVMDESPDQITKKTFTASYREFDESRYVDLVNRHSGSLGHRVEAEPSGLVDLERLLWFHDEPFHSFAAWASYRVMEMARDGGIVVLLNGQGADELLAGYPYYFGSYLAQMIRRGRAVRAIGLIRDAAHLSDEGVAPLLLRSLRKAAAGALGRGRDPGRVGRPSGPDRAEEADRFCFRPEFLDEAEGDPTCSDAVPIDDLLKNELHVATFGHHLPLFLRVEDRNSMALSLESRLPFLDHRLAELVFSMDSEVLMRGGYNKYLLREATAGILPDEVRWRRQKWGFPIPQARWLYEDLRDEVRDLIDSDAIGDDVLDAGRLRARFDRDAAARDPSASNFWFRAVSWALLRRLRDAGGAGDPGVPPAPSTIVNAWKAGDGGAAVHPAAVSDEDPAL